MKNNATEQASPKTGRGGTVPPKHAQFGQPNGNPRHNGSWKKEDTPRYKIEQMMKFSEAELVAVAGDKKAPYFERKLATAINKASWREIESMINQVYGLPKVTVADVTPERPLKGLTPDELRKALKIKRAKNDAQAS